MLYALGFVDVNLMFEVKNTGSVKTRNPMHARRRNMNMKCNTNSKCIRVILF